MNYYEKYIKKLLPERPDESNKGTYGHVLNIAGSGFYTGAAYFSSISPLKVGCGRSTLASTDTVLCAISALSPDIILMPLEETKEGVISFNAVKKLEKVFNNYEAISIGCGISKNKETVKFFNKVIKQLSKLNIPVVIDADGLNILSIKNEDKSKLDLPVNAIITPHPKELSRLIDVSVETILLQPEFWVKKCCEKFNCTVILKMHKTMVIDPKGNFYINNTGNSALSHGGSGDVLSGMISGFLAQGLSCFDASVLSVYLHGRAGEIASKELTEYSVLSSDLLNYIPPAIKSIL